jgi:hypothetical protein
VIANQIESIPVTFIDNGAFSGCISLTSVTIPDSVISIGKYAFEYCISLTSVIIPDSVTSIGYDTFYNCSSLTSVDIGNGVTSISNYTFRNCISLSSVSIGNGVESIGNYAFEGCSKLTSIEVDKNNQNYTSIDGNLYSKDKTILIKYAIGKTDKEFSIPDSATSIAEYAFYDCRSLTSVNIENGQLNKNKSAAEYNVI